MAKKKIDIKRVTAFSACCSLNRLIAFFLFFVGVADHVLATHAIEECSSIQRLDEVSRPSCSQLIIFDIDNTIYHPKQMVGSDEWVDYFCQKLQKQNMPVDEVNQTVLNLWTALQIVTKVIPVEKRTKEVVDHLQNENLFVMSMTSRSSTLAFTTFQQLDSVGISFEKTAPTKVRFQLNRLPDIQYEKGVLFTKGHHKGEALKEFLSQLQWAPKRIIYINDKIEPLEEVQVTLSDSVDYLGLRYNGANYLIEKFSPEIAEKELENFTKLLSNEEAASLILPDAVSSL